MKKAFFIFLTLSFSVITNAQNTLDILGLTSSTPAAAAYSLRKLSTAYSGNAIQVRRSSDNTNQNIGFTAGGDLDTATLKTFVGGSSGYITTWYDQSGYGRNLTQANTSLQPAILNAGVIYRRSGSPTLYHDAVNDGLGGASNYLTSNPLSVNIVAGSNASSTGMRRAVQGSSNWLIGPYGNKHSWYASGWNHQIASPWSLTSLEAFTVVQPSANACTSWRNGISQTTGNNKGVPNVINTGAIGAYVEPLDGFISEILVFSAELSNADRNSTECSQGSYYRITMSTACPTTIIIQPSSATHEECRNVSATPLSVTAIGANLTYQWYSNTSASNTGGASISGATSNTFTPPTTSLGTTYYYVIVTGTIAPTTATSNISGAITVKENPGLSNFAAVTRTYFDGFYTITPPSASSNGAITYTSSNTAVATISGTTVTLVTAGTSTITATQAATANYCGGSISALLTVNSVQVVTKSGQISATNTNYVSRNGSINGARGLRASGEIKITRSAGDGLTSSNPSTSAWQIKQDYPASIDGLYWIANPNINGGAPFQIYADMTTNGGGWTLIMKNTTYVGWTYANAISLNTSSPNITIGGVNYSIVGWADYIKKSASGFQYMIEASSRGTNGGIWTANGAYSFVNGNNTQTNVTINPKFGTWTYSDGGIEQRMPWYSNCSVGGFITTSQLCGGGAWWGTLVTDQSSWTSAPWIGSGCGVEGCMPSPAIIWYWVR